MLWWSITVLFGGLRRSIDSIHEVLSDRPRVVHGLLTSD